MLRSSLYVAGALLFAGSAVAQQDLSSRLRTVAGQPKHLTYNMATRTVAPTTIGSQSFFGPSKLYNNTCPQPAFIGLSPGDQVLDSGEVPASDNTFAGVDLGTCPDNHVVNGFQIFYCSDQPSNDLVITFHESYDPCTDISASPVTAGFLIAGLPGSTSGGALCYIVDIDLMGTSLEFSLAGSQDGTWDASDALDAFGYTYEFTNITGAAVGPIVSGGSVILGTGCDWSVDTIFEQGDPTGSSPDGTGWGSTDAFGIQDTTTGMLVGCFFFGGYPANIYSSFHMVLYSESECGSAVGAIVCDGRGLMAGGLADCPCGNNSPSGGCLNTDGTGGALDVPVSASLTMGDLTVTAHYPAGNSSLFLGNTSPPGGAASVFDGVACVGGGPRIFPGADNGTGDDAVAFDGLRTQGSFWAEMNVVAPGFVVAGTTYDVQCWYRDVLSGGPSTCGSGANFTEARSCMATP